MLRLLLFILLGSASLQAYTGCEQVEDQCPLTIQTPDLYKQQRRKIRLHNGLEALLISDPCTRQSGASLAVNVGSWNDPDEIPGMAHLVEHMLFMGTEKYPQEAEYTRYLDEHGGRRNAFTMSDRTLYMFSINNNAFLEALDRFSQFFISPLFNASCLQRELHAIHQEFCKYLPSDSWRLLQVRKELANSEHPFHRFSIGNTETLGNIHRDKIAQWYHSHYSANLMHLVVCSPLPLDLLQKHVCALFSQVKNKNCQPPHSTATLFKSAPVSICCVESMQDRRLLELTWPLPRLHGRDQEHHVDWLVGHILGHEGTNSLLAQLKKQNLAHGLAAGAIRMGGDQCLFSISIQLTPKGMQEYEQIISHSFAAIAALRQEGIPQFVFNEISQMRTINYQFQPRKDVFDLVTDHAIHLIEEPLASYPHKSTLPTLYDPWIIEHFLAALTPTKCRYTLLAPHAEESEHRERWFGVPYSEHALASSSIRHWETARGEITPIPHPNPFIPHDLVVNHMQKQDDAIHAELIVDDSAGRLYIAQDARFFTPEISWHFTFKTPKISDADPSSHVLADLLCKAVHEQLKTTAYAASLAGLHFTLAPGHNALELSVKGYSEKAFELLRAVVETIKEIKPSQEHFATYYDKLARDYTNQFNLTPLDQGRDLIWSVLFKNYSGLQEKISSVQQVKYEEMCAFCDCLFDTCYTEATLYGSLTQKDVREVWNFLSTTLNASPYPKALHPKIALATLPSGQHPHCLTFDSHHPANAVILVTECGPFSLQRRGAQEILMRGLKEPFFTELRTRQQTAYIVHNWCEEKEQHLYNFFAIQSSSHDARDLLSRFELFIESSLCALEERVIPPERFESIKQARIEELRRPPDHMGQMGDLIHHLAFSYEGDFSWLERRAAAIEELSYSEFLQHAREYLKKENSKRLAVCIRGDLPCEGCLRYTESADIEEIRDHIEYTSRQRT